MAVTRTYKSTVVYASNATVPTPGSPTPGIAYRKDNILDSTVEAGTIFKTINPSPDFNQVLFQITSMTQGLDQGGILGWTDTVDYVLGAIARGSDSETYRALQVSGPATTIADPVGGPSGFWEKEHGGGTPVGTSLPWFSNIAAIPDGFLECDGSAVSRTVYSLLFGTIGTEWGVGDGSTTFNLPDARGEFLRGFDNGRGIDSGRVFAVDQAQQTAHHKHIGTWGLRLSGRVGKYGNTSIETYDGHDQFGLISNSALFYTNDGSAESIDNPNTVGVIGTETRPRNITIKMIIKF